MLVDWKFGSLTRMWENLCLAYQAVLSNGYRSLLTILMLAVGVAALVGILATGDALRASVAREYAHLGAHSFVLAGKSDAPVLKREELRRLQLSLDFAGVSSVYAVESGVVLKSMDRSTPPTVNLIGTDDHFASLQGLVMAQGRFLRPEEVTHHVPCAVLGSVASEMLYGQNPAVGQWVRVFGKRYYVIGVLAPCKERPDLDLNRSVCVPLGACGRDGELEMGFRPAATWTQDQADSLVYAARVRFRALRGLRPTAEDDFEICRSDALIGELEASLWLITRVSLVIAALALLGAAVGLMNTLLISVRERHLEVGLRMALGATARQVLWQFWVEAAWMGALGALLGIGLGFLLAWIAAQFLGAPCCFSVRWLLLALVLCEGIALLAGSLPAYRVARLDPILALREK